MSNYAGYDHADWVQSSVTAFKKYKANKRERELAADHKGWHGAPATLNSFHKRAFTILGLVGGGIYNCPIGWKSLHWWPNQIIVPWHKGFGTWDFNELTMFTFLCHVARIRGYIGPCNKNYLHISLSQRQAVGDISRRHPNLDEAVAQFQSWYPRGAGFLLNYPGDAPPALSTVRDSITDYHKALDNREHGGVAAHAALDRIMFAMGMPWVQGATLPAVNRDPNFLDSAHSEG